MRSAHLRKDIHTVSHWGKFRSLPRYGIGMGREGKKEGLGFSRSGIAKNRPPIRSERKFSGLDHFLHHFDKLILEWYLFLHFYHLMDFPLMSLSQTGLTGRYGGHKTLADPFLYPSSWKISHNSFTFYLHLIVYKPSSIGKLREYDVLLLIKDIQSYWRPKPPDDYTGSSVCPHGLDSWKRSDVKKIHFMCKSLNGLIERSQYPPMPQRYQVRTMRVNSLWE